MARSDRVLQQAERGEGKRPAYRIEGEQITPIDDADGYRLPTEAQWEFACRAGTNTLWYFGNDVGVDSKDFLKRCAAANPFGLVGLYGQSNEWCWDGSDGKAYSAALLSRRDDPREDAGSVRIKRGGSSFATGGGDRTVINSFARGTVHGGPFDSEPLKYHGFGRVVLPIAPCQLTGPSGVGLLPATSPQSPAASPSPAIPAETLTFGGHRYLLVDSFGTWNEHRAKAEAMGGHLATINSPAELDWVKNVILPQRNRQGRMAPRRKPTDKDAWTWITGEPFDRSLWVGKLSDNSDDSLVWNVDGSWGTVLANSQQARFYYSLVEWDTLGSAARPQAVPPWRRSPRARSPISWPLDRRTAHLARLPVERAGAAQQDGELRAIQLLPAREQRRVGMWFVANGGKAAGESGQVNDDLWLTRRKTLADPWKTAINVGPPINGSKTDKEFTLTADRLQLVWQRSTYLQLSSRAALDKPWSEPVDAAKDNYGYHPVLSPDGLTLYYCAGRRQRFAPWARNRRIDAVLDGTSRSWSTSYCPSQSILSRMITPVGFPPMGPC